MKKATLEPTTRAFLEKLSAQGGKPIDQLSYPDARETLEALQMGQGKRLPADVEDKILETGPDGEVPVTIYRPKGARGALPVILYFHGGGWILGSKNTHDRLVRDLVNGTGAAVVFVNFTPAPDAQFPAQIEESYAALQYIAENGKDFDLDASRLAVAGDSVGGNMAAVVAHLARERGGPSIRYQALFYPVTDSSLSQKSYEKFEEGYWLTTAAMRWMWEAYLPNPADRKLTTASLLSIPLEQLKGLPPTLLLAAENDVLRDEGEAYAKKLMRAGVEVTVARFLGTIHDFVMLNALAETPAARAAIQLASRKLSEALGLEARKQLAA